MPRVAGVGLLAVSSIASALASAVEQESAKESPIKRVVGLLQKMKGELEAEADKEAEMYDKMVCWCETSEKEKTTAVAQAEATIADLQAEIEERAARFGTLGTEIEQMKKQIAEDTAALKEATGIREREASEFRGDEKDSVQAITNLKNAIRVLGKHQGLDRGLKDPKGAAALLQSENAEMSGLRVVLREVAEKYELLMAGVPTKKGTVLLQTDEEATSSSDRLLELLGGVADQDALPLKFAERVLARAAAEKKGTSFLQQPMSQSYASQSDGIFGILTTMLEEFESTLKTTQSSESTATKDFEAMAAAKEEQIAVGKEKLDELQGGNAGNQKALSDAKENLQLTTEQRSADVEFLRNLKLTCNDLDAQWEARSKTRSEEIVAVAETITILTEDDNHEQLKAGGVALLQVEESTSMRARRSKASALLRKAAKAPEFDGDDLLAAWANRKHAVASMARGPRMQLSTLAVSMQIDGFEKVKAMIDELTAELKKQQEEEVAFKAHCTKELDANEKDAFNKKEQIEDHETDIKKLAALMEKLAEEIKAANEQIAATQLEVKTASQTREQENAEFQQVVSDQRATQEILNKALQRLKDFYAKKLTGGGTGENPLGQLDATVAANAPGVVLAQTNSQHKQTPPVMFNKMKENAGASPVMSLIDQIIGDSKKLESEAISGEYAAQDDYEKMVLDANALVKDLEEAVSSKSKASAQAKKEQGATESSLQLAQDELTSLEQVEADLHNECDFVLKNFDIRQKARMQEMEAIAAAKAMLSGMQ